MLIPYLLTQACGAWKVKWMIRWEAVLARLIKKAIIVLGKRKIPGHTKVEVSWANL